MKKKYNFIAVLALILSVLVFILQLQFMSYTLRMIKERDEIIDGMLKIDKEIIEIINQKLYDNSGANVWETG